LTVLIPVVARAEGGLAPPDGGAADAPVATTADAGSGETATAPAAPPAADAGGAPARALPPPATAPDRSVRAAIPVVAAPDAPSSGARERPGVEASARAAVPSPVRELPLSWEMFRPWSSPPEGASITGYAQVQYESHQDSHNQLFQGGVAQNKDRFYVRRARLQTAGEWQYSSLIIELDANNVNGPQVDPKKVEASLQYRPDRTRPPLVIATMGLFDTPFGYELVEVPRTRWFMEQATAWRALWPGTADVGVRVAGAAGFLRWTVSALNGHPQGETSPYVLQDPTDFKDVVLRVGADVKPRDGLEIAGDISSEGGKGFHPGTDATKATVQWTDTNRDGVLQPNELMGVPAQAATPSRTFDRFAIGADLRVSFRTRLGVTRLYGEFVVASNMDRGLFVADPILTGVDQRELGYYVGVVQQLGRYGVVGFRYDLYDPNSDAFDMRRARLLPYDQAIRTYAPLVSLTVFDHARLSFEYDHVTNALGRDSRGVPTSLAMDTWTLRLQVQQ
jgi:hypothetical protein